MSESRPAAAPETRSAAAVTAVEARRQYKREWARRHRDSVRESQQRYWQRVADRINEAAAAEEEEQKGGEEHGE